MPVALGPPYGHDDQACIEKALEQLAASRKRGSQQVSLDTQATLRSIGTLADDYILRRRTELDRLLDIAGEPQRPKLEQDLRDAWWVSGGAPGRPFMALLERTIHGLRDETRDRDVLQQFRRDLRSLASGRLRLGKALTRPYADELSSALRLGAASAGVPGADEKDCLVLLQENRGWLQRAAQAALDHKLLKNRAGPAGDEAAVSFAQQIDTLARKISGRRISPHPWIDSTNHQKHYGPGFRLLAACLRPLKPSLTDGEVVGLIRTMQTLEHVHAQLHDNS